MPSRAASIIIPTSFHWPDTTPPELVHALNAITEADIHNAGQRMAERLRARLRAQEHIQVSALFILLQPGAQRFHIFQHLPHHITVERLHTDDSCGIFIENTQLPTAPAYWNEFFRSARGVTAYALGEAELGPLSLPITTDASVHA